MSCLNFFLVCIFTSCLSLADQSELNRLKKENERLNGTLEKIDEAMLLMKKYSHEIQFIPIMNADKSSGTFEVSSVNPQSRWYKWGFREKDVITQVDSQKVTEPSQVALLLSSPENGGSHEAKVMRNGREKKIIYGK